jgi:hypothetical protein
MQVGFRDLTIWSFLMASAHGAGLMVLPVMLQLAPASHAHMHAGGTTGFSATAVHTLGYLIVTAVVAIVAYRKLGLSMLRKNWFNLDLVWAVALIVTGGVALLI